MKIRKINLALVSPQKNAVSETFIRAHKRLPFNIKYYYGGYFPNCLEGTDSLYHFNWVEKFMFKFFNKKGITKLALLKSFKKEKVDCILAEYGPTACEILEIARELGIPLVVHFHGFDATNPEIISNYSTRYKIVFAYASNVIVVSEKMKEDLIKLGCDEKKIVVTPCGPNPEFYLVNPSFEKKQFIAVARFFEVKGYLFTITAFKKVLEKHAGAKLICIGDGPQLESCKQFVKILKLENEVVFTGAASQSEIKLALSESSVFLQHSVTLTHGLNEGAPVSVMEAMAAALPVVCSNSGGIRDLVVNHETGFLVDEFDTESMAIYMIELMENKTLAEKMGEAGRARIIAELSQEKHLRIIETVIEKSVE
ncbi:MAG: glycosyltransferase family 4 protein [Ferruginibacter sp.]